ncbi:hypothetical protein CEE60_05040 [Stenotrophomonas maltophilia]|uniref:Uncharacterized protein n=1 Tax=Stenotrophomonas maltophilia TaxID=40324 RepID=A0A246HPW0_STEMA|nr:hypothetical protein CEE60_05040 [Stenotrophomonas maltophilia]
MQGRCCRHDLRASNGWCPATRLTEAADVRYPRDLRAVFARSVKDVAAGGGRTCINAPAQPPAPPSPHAPPHADHVT